MANEMNVTVTGRLSWPVWTMAEAKARNAKSPYPVQDDAVTTEFNLILDKAGFNKVVTHIRDVYLPFCVQQNTAGETRHSLTQKQADQILAVIEGDLDVQPPYVPLKPVPEKTLVLAPDAVAMLKVKGPRGGVDLVQKAVVNSESEMLIPDPDVLKYPILAPINQTIHNMYGGCYVAATLNLYSFISGKLPGMSASAGTVVFKADGDRFGGGVDVDEDEIFMD